MGRAMTQTGRLVFAGDEHGGDWTAGFERSPGAMLLGLFVASAVRQQGARLD
jgi:hypothetical protein